MKQWKRIKENDIIEWMKERKKRRNKKENIQKDR